MIDEQIILFFFFTAKQDQCMQVLVLGTTDLSSIDGSHSKVAKKKFLLTLAKKNPDYSVTAREIQLHLHTSEYH